jgi:hypothetical protein
MYKQDEGQEMLQKFYAFCQSGFGTIFDFTNVFGQTKQQVIQSKMKILNKKRTGIQNILQQM